MKRNAKKPASKPTPAPKRVRGSGTVAVPNQPIKLEELEPTPASDASQFDLASASSSETKPQTATLSTTTVPPPSKTLEDIEVLEDFIREAAREAKQAAEDAQFAANRATKALTVLRDHKAALRPILMDPADRRNQLLGPSSGNIMGPLSIAYLDGKDRLSIKPAPFSPDVASEMVEAATLASFTVNGRPTRNQDYRHSYEIVPPKLMLISDPSKEILDNLSRKLRGVGHDFVLWASILKLNMYLPDGHFGWHADRKRDDNHIGTLVVCLPSYFSGGQLVLRLENGEEEVHDWSTNGTGYGSHFMSDSEFTLWWAYIPLGVEHKVLPVWEGTRLTLQYAIYASQSAHSPEPESFLEQLFD